MDFHYQKIEKYQISVYARVARLLTAGPGTSFAICVSVRTKFVIGGFTLPVLLLLCSVPGCDTLVFPTGINGVAIVESGGGNVNPPPPITHDPLAGAIIIVQAESSGQEITSQIADQHGGFRIELPPGTYLLMAQVPQDSHFVLAPPEQTVVVLPHRLTQVVVTYAVVSHF